MSKCEECDADVSIPSDALEGEIVTCQNVVQVLN